MTIHISKDTGCNLSCSYCYEEPSREITENNVSSQSLDVDAVIERLEEFKENYSEVPGLHGGEPLLIDIEDLRTIYQWINDNYEEVREGQKTTHIQTNGTMINDDHVEMFRKYNVHVGISCDGPPELNKERQTIGASGEIATDKMSERTNDNIFRLAEEEGISVGIIVVAHKTNAGSDEKIDILLDWMDDLNRLGVSGHYNPAIPYEDIQTDISLTPDELKRLYLRTWEWMKEEDYRRWNPMMNYVDNLLGNKLTNCVNTQGCDVFNAGAAKIVTGEGETTGCGKTWSAVGDGVPFLQGPGNDSEYDSSRERYDMLMQTPGWTTDGEPDMGGCRGCEYWNVCGGGCPSSGLDHDFRNRTRWCEAKYALYEKIEQDMRSIMPNITLITDYPWNAKLADRASTWNLDIKPFAAMDPGEPGASSAWGGYSHGHGEPIDRVDGTLPDNIEDQFEFIEEAYPEEHVEIDREQRDWHVDSSVPEQVDWVKKDPLPRDDLA